MPKYLSGRVKRTPQNKLTDDRYTYLGLEQAEPNLGDPTLSLPSVPVGQQYEMVSFVEHPGERYWVVKSGGIIPGSISLYDEGSLVGTANSVTQVDFRGNAVTAIADPYVDGVSTGVAGTITIRPPGDNGSVLFKSSDDFATSDGLTFNDSGDRLSVGGFLDVGASRLQVDSVGVGILTAAPTQELHVVGDIRLEGTIYDVENNPGTPTNLLTRGADGVEWISATATTTGAGGTIYQVQYHNTAGLVDGASKLVYTANNDRVGIGSTQPTTLLDVLGPSIFTDGVTIDRLYVTTGISTFLNLIEANGGVTASTARISDLTQGRVVYVGPSGELVDSSDLTFDGSLVSTGVNVSGTTTTLNLNATGIATAGNIKISGNTVQTSTGGLTLDSTSGTVTVADILAVSDTTYSDDKDSGAVVIEGGVGIEKNLNVGENFKSIGVTTLASAGGITTTGGDLYVGGDLYTSGSTIVESGVFQRLYVSGISTFKDDVEFHGNAGVTSVFFDKDEDSLKILTGSKLVVGTDNLAGSNHVDIYNSGGSSYISGIGTFDLKINSETVRIGGNSGKSSFVGIESGSSILFFNDANKLQTSGIGITVTGVTSTTSAYVTSALTVDGDTRLNGSSIYLGSDDLDNIYFQGEVNSSIVPNTPTSFDLGSDLKRWNTVYARNLEGLTNVDIENLYVTGITTFKNDVQLHGDAGVTSVRWDKSQNSLEFIDGAYATWGTGRDLQIYHDRSLADQTDSNGDNIVDGRTSIIKENGSGGIVFKSNGGDGPGAYQFFDQLWQPMLKMHGGTNARTLLYAKGIPRVETSGVGVTFYGNAGINSMTVSGIATFYGPVHDKDGQVGAAGSLLQSTGSGVDWVNATGLSVDKAEQVRISQKSNDDTYFLTFVDTNVDASFQGICVDDGGDSLTWNPSANLFTVQNIKPVSIQQADGSSGTGQQVITADGSGGWTWENNDSGGIGTVFVKQFTNASSSSIAPFIPVPVERLCTSYITVDQTTSGIATIGIAETSNAYGNHWTQSDDPTSVDGGENTVCDGDFWYDTTDNGGYAAAGGMTILDEGVTLPTIATTLNFVGGGVAATGTGATKTITISGSGGSSTLSGLTDTTIATPIKNQTLIYDATTSKWRNITQSVANVKDYGAVGDNSTDDTAAIQAAIDSLSGGTYDGGTVYFPAGIYRISSALSIDSADNSITLKGCSTHFPLSGDGSLIRSTSTTANGIEITNSLSVSIQNLRIDTSVTKTDGIAIDCESSTDIQGITIDQVYINGFCKGINITGYSVSAVRNTEIRAQPNSANSTYGILVDKGSDTRVDQIRFQNIIIDAVHSGSSKHDYSSGFLFKNYVNSIWMYDCAVLRSKIGIDFDSTLGAGTATTGAYFRLTNCDVDQNKEDGVYINGGTQIWIDNPYLSSNGQNGLETGTSFGGTLWITNADARGNGYHGINISGTSAKKIHITNPHCAVNSTASSDTYHGINVASDADDIHIVGGQCGGDVYGTTTGATTNGSISQSYGIMFLGNNHKRIQIRGVDCTDNHDGAIGWQTSGDNVTAGSYNWIQYVAGYSTGQTTFP